MTDSSIRAMRQREAQQRLELQRVEEQREAARRKLLDKPAGDTTGARLASLERQWHAFQQAANRAAREQQQRALHAYRARLLDEMQAIVNASPAPMQPIEPTGSLGTPNFDATLMTAPLRWF